jgi:hypothetical protein
MGKASPAEQTKNGPDFSNARFILAKLDVCAI